MVTPLIVKYNLSATVATARLTRPAISLKYLASLLSGTIPRPISLVTNITVLPSLHWIAFNSDSNSNSIASTGGYHARNISFNQTRCS